jgi:hypothetical protein
MRLKASLVAPAMIAVICALAATIAGWLALLTLPWLAALVYVSRKDPGDVREFPSAAEASRDRLWTR